ncbi:hypothetical protein B4065_1993 [Caldibacillus thermoamylovorans]|nr:hypothetical protein B4065_1993 [Caldibacillus thermoamylovorans]
MFDSFSQMLLKFCQTKDKYGEYVVNLSVFGCTISFDD